MPRDKEKQRLYKKAWNLAHPEKLKHYQLTRHSQKHSPEYQKEWRRKHPEKQREYSHRYDTKHPERTALQRIEHQRRTRQRVFEYIGGAKCRVCGYTDTRALVIDHKNNDGHDERFGLMGKRGVCYFLRILRMPQSDAQSKYQVLCANCNMIKENILRMQRVTEKLERLRTQNSISTTRETTTIP